MQEKIARYKEARDLPKVWQILNILVTPLTNQNCILEAI
jgi:hypothetical protein